MTCYCIESQGLRHIDFDNDLLDVESERIEARRFRFERISQNTKSFLSGNLEVNEFVGILNSLGLRIPHSDSTSFSEEVEKFINLSMEINISSQFTKLNNAELERLGRIESVGADIRVTPERRLGHTAASLVLASLHPNQCIVWNSSLRLSNPEVHSIRTYAEYLYACQDIARCLKRQIPFDYPVAEKFSISEILNYCIAPSGWDG